MKQTKDGLHDPYAGNTDDLPAASHEDGEKKDGILGRFAQSSPYYGLERELEQARAVEQQPQSGEPKARRVWNSIKAFLWFAVIFIAVILLYKLVIGYFLGA